LAGGSTGRRGAREISSWKSTERTSSVGINQHVHHAGSAGGVRGTLGGLAMEPEIRKVHAKSGDTHEKYSQNEQHDDDDLSTLVLSFAIPHCCLRLPHIPHSTVILY
jgi:hypothetical protein